VREAFDDYIALLVAVVVVLVSVVVDVLPAAFMSVAFMSVAFMSVVVVVAFMSVVVRFSSTFMVLLALSLLLQAASARAAPATRIRARIQDSLFIAI
jgi:membrane-associated HD superfamily phosphohydrolase